MRSRWQPIAVAPLLMVLLCAAGCGGAGSTAAKTPTTPSPSPTTTAPFMVVDPHNPVLTHGQAGAWSSNYVDPGAIVYHSGQFHMFFDGSAAYPAPVGIGYATSPDGSSWTAKVAPPVFRSQQVPFARVAIFVTSALVLPNGTWALYFEAVNGNGAFPASSPGNTIGRATAPGPNGPWTPDPAPVLGAGPAGAWDDVTVGHPTVVKTTGGYALYYAGVGDDGVPRIGMATSPDGVHWTKYKDPALTGSQFAQTTPVLLPGAPSSDAWDGNGVMDPSVQHTPDGWVMSYLTRMPSNGGGNGPRFAFGLARSADGRTWTKLKANPILTTVDQPWSYIFLSTLQYWQGTYFLLFDVQIGTSANTTDVYLATHTGVLGG
jgi:hypothetical protein